jgi:GNAT superfamily N-acetyltransferase
MKTFREFILEAKQADPDALHTITTNWRKKHPKMKFHATIGHMGDIRLHSIEVPKPLRGQGLGSRAIKGLSKYADNQQKRITLSQAPDKGYKGKLDRWYRKQGFKPNKGRNKDFRVSDTMIRDPN